MRKWIQRGGEGRKTTSITSGRGIVTRLERARAAVKPRVAVGPLCGEASIYVEAPEKLKKSVSSPVFPKIGDPGMGPPKKAERRFLPFTRRWESG